MSAGGRRVADIRRPTIRAVIVLVLAAVLLFAGSTAQAGWLFVVAAVVLAVPLSSLVVRHRLAAIDVRRVVAPAVTVGEPAEVGLKLISMGRRVPLLALYERFEAFAPVKFAVEFLGPGETSVARLDRLALRRGVFPGGPVELVCGWPFGMARSRRSIEVESPVVVVPASFRLASFPLLEPSSHPAEVLHERARVGAGLDYRGTRDYRPGDSVRAVHWRSSARSGRLVVREFEEQSQTRVAIVLTGADHGPPPDSSFEALVSAVASIGRYALETGHPIDLIGMGHDGEPDVLAGPDSLAALRWLAAVRPADSLLAAVVQAALARVGRRGTVVIAAPSAGRTADDLPAAIRTVQASGSRAIAVIARCSSWRRGTDALQIEEELLFRELGARVPLRLLTRGEDVGRCLEG